MGYFEDRMASITSAAGPGVVGMLAWVDPTGQWWMAPLGSQAPDPDRPVPAAWVPIKRLSRDEVE